MRALRGICLFLFSFLLSVISARAQEVRASITGIVTDASGVPLPEALITVTNLTQYSPVSTKTDEKGYYVTPFLAPGAYRLTAEHAGFQKFAQEGIILQAQGRARVDVSLRVVVIGDSVPVSLLQTDTATRSQVLSNELIADLPTQGRNPFQIAWDVPGVVEGGSWRYLRAFDVAATSALSINGGKIQENEVLLDGISDMRGDRTVVHVPTMDSVQELTVMTNVYDAQFGRTGGGVVTMVTKSGGNALHGRVYEYFQNNHLDANTFELNAGGLPKPGYHINTFGIEASGPIYIPKVVNGRNKLFWMFSYEGMRQRTGDPGQANVPLTAWRSGNFSSLVNGQGQPVLIYDPLNRTASGGRVPFTGNIIPANRINPVAAAALQYYPAADSAGSGPAHLSNYVYPSRWVGSLNQEIGRVDYAINGENRIFFRYGQNPYREDRGLVFGSDVSQASPAEPTGSAPLMSNGRSWTFDWAWVASPRMAFDLRAGVNRWEETSGNSFGAGFNPAQLGFAGSLVSQFSQLQFPYFQLGSYQAIGSSRLIGQAADDVYSLQPNMSLMRGRHIMKFGGEVRRYNDNSNNPGMASGSYTFGKNWTQQNPQQGDAVSGNELATFLLGYPSSGFVDRNIAPAYTNNYWAVFFQDAWKLTRNLSLNLGIRWDYETPVIERYDQQLRGFSFFTPSAIASRATTLSLLGNVLFAGGFGAPRTAFDPDRNNTQPRVGAAYHLGDRWVVRGGYGLYYLGQNEAGSPQGFSRTTNVATSTDGGITPAAGMTLANPFANLAAGKLLAPIGSTLAGGSFVGEPLNVNYVMRPLPYSHQYSVDIERELPLGFLLDLGYSGNQSRKLPVSSAVDVLPASALGRRTATGAIDTSYYNALITNPLRTAIPNNPALNGSTIAQQLLLVPYPQYAGITLSNMPIGRQRYDAFQAKVTRRFSSGPTILAGYTLSKNLEQVSPLNAQDIVLLNVPDSRLEKRSAAQIDIPQKFTLAGVYELPVGRKRRFGSAMPKLADYAAGGWTLNWDITYQSGWALDYPNAAQVQSGSAKLSDPSIGHRFNTSLWTDASTGSPVAAQEPFTLRNFPTRFGNVRVPGFQNWDLSIAKYFPVTDRIRMQLRAEAINAFNHPWFTDPASGGLNVTSPAFGQLNPTQDNLPRSFKLTLAMNW